VTARINIVHKLYDRKGGVSGYMVKNGHGTRDEYRVYDAEGNFLYGIVGRQPWTVFRIFDQDGRLIHVGCTRTKNLRKRLELLAEPFPKGQEVLLHRFVEMVRLL
jgi:hypothetical protein